jgi:cell division protein FtsQ
VAPIDPRIRARRIDVRRREGRRRLQRLVDAAVVVLVALAFLGALWTPLLDVDEVRVSGAARTGEAAVADEAGVAVGDPLIRVDLGAVGARVADLPWVAEVRLSRGVDGLVEVAVTERLPIAAVGTGPTAVLVDVQGRVLGPVSEVPAEAPFVQLTGVGPAPAPGGYLDADAADALALAAQLAAVAPGTLATLDADQLTGTLLAGGQVRFGDARQLDAKAGSLRTMLEQVDLSCLAVLDLRLPGSPVLTREEGCS